MTGPIQKILNWLDKPWLTLGRIAVAAGVLALITAGLAVFPATQITRSALEFELAGTSDGALAILREFVDTKDGGENRLRQQVQLAIYFDFLLIVGYAIGLASLLEWLAVKAGKKADELLPYAAWGAIWAGCLDVVENIAMLTMLQQSTESPGGLLGVAAFVSALAALFKWTLITAVMGYSTWEVLKYLQATLIAPGPKGTPAETGAPPAPKPAPATDQPQQAAPFSKPREILPESAFDTPTAMVRSPQEIPGSTQTTTTR